MFAPIIKRFTAPNVAWTDVRCEAKAHPKRFLAQPLVPGMILDGFNVLSPEYLCAPVD